jgi:DNA-binding response OmpR family regulator
MITGKLIQKQGNRALQSQEHFAARRQPAIRILVVEDDKDIRQVLCLYINYAGFEVLGAADGQQAIDVIGDYKPHLIVLDLMMQPVDGWEVLHWLRSRRVPPPPVLILTALTQLEQQVHGFEEGALEYMTKPMQPYLLVERITKVLKLSLEQRSRLRQERQEKPRRTLESISAPQADEFLY